jgi:hypothetical protein
MTHGADADLRLAGLGEHHAEVRRDEFDEYIYVDLGTSAGSRVDGTTVGSRALHTGDRIELGTWTLSREEFADHGGPYGGRQGGEFSLQRTNRAPVEPPPAEAATGKEVQRAPGTGRSSGRWS